MTRKILLLSIAMAFLISGCGWSSFHIPFFGSKKVQEEEPLVQDSAKSDEEPQYSGQDQNAGQNQQYPNPYQTPTAANPYAPAPLYGQAQSAAGAFQPGQPYNPNTNYATNATPGYAGTGYATPAYTGAAAAAYGTQGAYGAPAVQPYYGAAGAESFGQNAAYGAYPAPQTANNLGSPYSGGMEATNFGNMPAPPANTPDSFFGTPQKEDFAFGGIKRKTLFIISYPQRGLSTTPYDDFSQKIYQRLAQASGINLIPREAVDNYNNAHQSFNTSIDNRERLSKLGQELGAQAIILERLIFTSNYMAGGYAAPNQQVELQLIDTATGYPVKTYTLNPAAPGAEQVVNSLINHVRMIDWSARVIKVENKRILINAGRLSGLQGGQNLRVYAKGSEIKDPSSQLSLGQAQGALKGTVKIVDFFGLDGAICEPLAAGNFAQDDMIKAIE
ncbi:MAG: hypothetical protein JXR80_06945 [Deltaproteobacteria bacterium]|nr:hypothetical protein [Deltaproteobacteria bacterium]